MRKRPKYAYDITYTWDLKYGTNECIYKTETDSQTQGTDEVAKGEGDGGEKDWECGMSK